MHTARTESLPQPEQLRNQIKCDNIITTVTKHAMENGECMRMELEHFRFLSPEPFQWLQDNDAEIDRAASTVPCS